jgi:hypothetical protein
LECNTINQIAIKVRTQYCRQHECEKERETKITVILFGYELESPLASHFIQLTPWSSVLLEQLPVAQLLKNFQHERSLPCSQKPSTCLYPKQEQSSPHNQPPTSRFSS